MRVAIVGGTGDFGLALAARLVEAGDDVVIGSRDAERAQEKAREVGAAGGAANEDAVAGRGPRRARDEGRRQRSTTAAALADAIGATPVLSVASDQFGGRPDRRALARRANPGRSCEARSSPGSTRSPRGKLAHGRPDEDASSAATTPRRRSSRSSSRRRSSPAARSTPGRSRARARSKGMTAVIVSLNKRYKGHAGIRVTGLP